MPVASLSWVPPPTLLYLLPRHSFRPLLSRRIPLRPPYLTSFLAVPSPRPRRRASTTPGRSGQPKTLSMSLVRCSGAADGKEIKKWSMRNEDGDNTHGGRVLLLTAAAQILDPHYPRAPQKQSSISVKERQAHMIFHGASIRFFIPAFSKACHGVSQALSPARVAPRRVASRRVYVKETLVNRFRVARSTFNGVICNKLDALR